MSKKGQGLSLNVIIVAALALIVLVILIVVFTGRLAIFDRGLTDTGGADLGALKITYGDCHPSPVEESRFTTALNGAETPEDESRARDDFKLVIRDCKTLDTLGVCETNDNCDWQ